MGNTKLGQWKGSSPTWWLRVCALAGLLASIALIATACGDSGGDAPKAQKSGVKVYTASTADDPNRYLVYYPIIHHLVNNPNVKINLKLLPFATAAEAYQKKQYNLVEANFLNVAQGAQQGFNTEIVSFGLQDKGSAAIVVKKGSNIKSPADLKGKKVGIQVLQTIFGLTARSVLKTKYGLNTNPEKGDIKWVEIPEIPTLYRLLDKGDIAAIVTAQIATWQTVGNPGGPTTLLMNAAKEFNATNKTQGILSTSWVTYKDANIPEKDITALRALFKADTDYLYAHEDELVAKVAKERDVDPAYLKWFLENVSMGTGPITPAQQEALKVDLGAAADLGMIKPVSDPGAFYAAPTGGQ
jgi:ABC-type nitrate/sulfonate/bicarbonate transport system substrate-binding protein